MKEDRSCFVMWLSHTQHPVVAAWRLVQPAGSEFRSPWHSGHSWFTEPTMLVQGQRPASVPPGAQQPPPASLV